MKTRAGASAIVPQAQGKEIAGFCLEAASLPLVLPCGAGRNRHVSAVCLQSRPMGAAFGPTSTTRAEPTTTGWPRQGLALPGHPALRITNAHGQPGTRATKRESEQSRMPRVERQALSSMATPAWPRVGLGPQTCFCAVSTVTCFLCSTGSEGALGPKRRPRRQ